MNNVRIADNGLIGRGFNEKENSDQTNKNRNIMFMAVYLPVSLFGGIINWGHHSFTELLQIHNTKRRIFQSRGY